MSTTLATQLRRPTRCAAAPTLGYVGLRIQGLEFRVHRVRRPPRRRACCPLQGGALPALACQGALLLRVPTSCVIGNTCSHVSHTNCNEFGSTLVDRTMSCCRGRQSAVAAFSIDRLSYSQTPLQGGRVLNAPGQAQRHQFAPTTDPCSEQARAAGCSMQAENPRPSVHSVNNRSVPLWERRVMHTAVRPWWRPTNRVSGF